METLLTGNLGLLTLAPLTDEAEDQLPMVLGRIDSRLRQEATPEEAQKLRITIFVLLGLRYSKAETQKLFEGVTTMEESVTYQAIIAKGREKGIPEGERREAQKLLQRLGRKRFGPPDPATIAHIESLTDLEHLEQLSERVLEVSSWQELFR